MGRKPCCAKETDLKRGAWTAEEDGILEAYIKTHGEGRWRSLPKKAGADENLALSVELLRCRLAVRTAEHSGCLILSFG